MDEASLVEEKLNKTLDNLYNDVYKGYILEIQKQSYLCSADCCSKFTTQKEVVNCTESCSEKLKKIFKKIEDESDNLNQSLGRCMMTCQDKQKRKYNKEFSMLEPELKKDYENGIMKCITGCFNDHINDLPKLKERLINFIKKT